MADQPIDRTISDKNPQGPKTTSPGGRFESSREGFSNNPHFDYKSDTSATGDFPATPQGATRNDNVGAFDRARQYVSGGLGQLRDTDVVGRIATHAKENPWMHIGLAGVGGLLLGYFVGKSTIGSSPMVGVYGEEIEEIDEDEY